MSEDAGSSGRGTKQKAVVPVSEIEEDDDIWYSWMGERYTIGDVMIDDDSGYVYVALLDTGNGEFEQLDHFKPSAEATVYTSRTEVR